MRVRPRATDVYVLAAMLLAATVGRLLDAAGLLPGVHEAGIVSGGRGGWLTALLGAVVVAFVAAQRWAATRSLTPTALAAMVGQLVVFFGAEAAGRLARGSAPLDPDGIVGGLLQAGLGAALLLALTVAADVGLHLRPAAVLVRAPTARPPLLSCASSAGRGLTALVDARGPPAVARC